MRPVEQPMGRCPCGWTRCTVWGTKLSRKTGHVIGCLCDECKGGRNRSAGKRAQNVTAERLGQGVATTHEERGRFVDLTVRPEVKAGAQVPASFRTFVEDRWIQRALSQSRRAIPVGVDARPAVSIDGRWMLVDLLSDREWAAASQEEGR